MLVYSHRGYHRQAPENTLAAFTAAADLRVDGIETDLRLSADGEIILYHDRLTRDRREVRHCTAAELSRIAGYEVPTLLEALDGLRDVMWMLEIKDPSVVDPLLPMLAKYQGTHQLMVTSFWHPAIDRVRRAVPVECGLLTAHRPLDPISDRLARYGDGTLLAALVWHYDYLSPELVGQAKALGTKSYVFAVHTPSDHDHAAACGVDGIITDEPTLVRRSPRTG